MTTLVLATKLAALSIAVALTLVVASRVLWLAIRHALEARDLLGDFLAFSAQRRSTRQVSASGEV